MLVNKKRRDARWEGEREGGVFQGKASADKMSFDHCHVSDNRHHLNTQGSKKYSSIQFNCFRMASYYMQQVIKWIWGLLRFIQKP